MADEADKPIPQFLALVGIALIGAALEAMLTSSGFNQIIPYSVILLGVFLFFAGCYWSYFKTLLGAIVTALIVRVGTDSRVWFGLAFAL